MEWLNYHHLLYFWTVAREGSIARASAELRLAQPTISGQLRTLEQSLGGRLFTRVGRGLVLTDTGRLVFSYANDIFGLGRELMTAVRGHATDRPLPLAVGITDAVPKLLAHRLLGPALRLRQPIRLVCREGRSDRLLAALALHELDLVLSDAPAESGITMRTFHRLLVDCGASFCASPKLANRHARGFPWSLDGTPVLMPRAGSAFRVSLERWFDAEEIRPHVVGEFDDTALLKAFGEGGAGIFPVPTVIEREVRRQHGVRTIGRTTAVRERFYAISAERRLTHPGVVAIHDAVQRRAPIKEA